MAIEMVTLTTTLPQRPCSPSAGSKSGCYTPSVRLQQEDPLCLKAHQALFEDLRGVTWDADKCPEGHVRQTSSRKAVLEWKSGCCGEDQSRTRTGALQLGPPPVLCVCVCVCVCVFDLVSLCVCLIWFITLLLLANFTHSCTHASTGRQADRADTVTHKHKYKHTHAQI